MKFLLSFIFGFVICICVSFAASIENSTEISKDAKSAFGQAFDEIVVESHLTVRRKTNGRQGRNQNITNNAGIIKTKREIKLPNSHELKKKSPNFFNLSQNKLTASSANSQSQAFNSFGPLGNFGASASSSQSQNFAFGPNGPITNAGFSGSQQYNFNGQTFDISFGNAFAGDGRNQGAVVTITGPDGKKRPLNG